MHVLTWLVRGVLFVVLMGLAIKNSADVELRFFFDTRWQAPLSLVVLVAFATGALAGLLALLPQWIRQRRQIGRMSKQSPAVQNDKLTHGN